MEIRKYTKDLIHDVIDFEKRLRECAELYYKGMSSKKPTWEYLSNKMAIAINDISHILHK